MGGEYPVSIFGRRVSTYAGGGTQTTVDDPSSSDWEWPAEAP
jgi:hypothetical protein